MTGFYTDRPNVYEELDSVKEEYDDVTGATTAEVTLRAAWSESQAVTDDILLNKRRWPWRIRVGNRPIAKKVKVIPQGCLPNLSNNEFNVYENSLITVTYSNDPKLAEITETYEPTAEFYKLDYQEYSWAEDNKPLSQGEAPGRLIKGGVVTRTLNDVYFPFAKINDTNHPDDGKIPWIDFAGTVNKEIYIFDVLQLTFQPEHLLYASPRLTVKRKITGENVIKSVQKFHFKPGGWNNFWRPSIGKYDHILDEFYVAVDVYETKDWLTWLGAQGQEDEEDE